MVAALLRGLAGAAARPDWTPEECGRFAAARDAAFLKALAADVELRTAARRFGSLIPRPEARTGSSDACASAAAAGTAARSTASEPASARRDGSARPAGARAADRPPRGPCGIGDGSAVARARAERTVQRPRRRSEAKLAERQAQFEAKWRRRKFLEVLPIVGAYIRRSAPAAPVCPHPSGAGDGLVLQPAPLAGAKRNCMRRASTSAGSDEADGKRCAGGGGSAEPAACAVGSSRSERHAVRVRGEWGSEQVQWHGRCEGGCGRACVPLTEMAGQWLCEDCWVIALSASLWSG